MTQPIGITQIWILASVALAAVVLVVVVASVILRRRSARRATRWADEEAELAVVPAKPAEASLAIDRATPAETDSDDDLPPPPPTPLTTRLPALIAQALRHTVVLREVFPPAMAAGSNSFYGGVPRVPGGLVWPRAASGRPLHFLLQIDCATLPAAARLGRLPDHGALLFFRDMAGGDEAAGQVLWLPAAPGTDTAAWREVAPPPELPSLPFAPASSGLGDSPWAWADDPRDVPPVLPRWPFTPVMVPLGDPDPAPPPTIWPDTEATTEALASAQGTPLLVYALSPRDFADDGRGAMRRPWPGFPHDWLAIRICSAMLARTALRALERGERSLYADLPPEQRNERLAAIAGEAREWADVAGNKPPFAAVAERYRAIFWQWFSGHAELARLVAPQACIASIECTLHNVPSSADTLPSEVIGRLAYRHGFVMRTDSGLYASVPNRLLGPPGETASEAPSRVRRQILLLELTSNPALGHDFGEALCQFWISPEDLAHRRFERAEATIAPLG